jgi:hypothetical protein
VCMIGIYLISGYTTPSPVVLHENNDHHENHPENRHQKLQLVEENNRNDEPKVNEHDIAQIAENPDRNRDEEEKEKPNKLSNKKRRPTLSPVCLKGKH